MGPGNRKNRSLVPILDPERNDFMCDDTLGWRLKRRKTGNHCFSMDNSNGKSQTCKFIKPLKNNSPESHCLLIHGDDNSDSEDDDDDDDGVDDDYAKFYHGLVSGLFPDCDAHDNANTFSSKKMNGRNSGGESIEPPTNSLQGDDSDDDGPDENYRMFVEDVTRGLNIDSSWDVYWDRESSSFKKNNAVRSTDNDDNNVDVDLVNESVENIIGGSGPVDDKVDGGNDDARAEDNDDVVGSLNNVVLGEKLVDYVGNIVDARYEVNDAHNDDILDDTEPHYKVFLDNFRQDGNSYVLELSLTNEMSLIVRYESQDGPRHGCNINKHDSKRDCPKRENTKTKGVSCSDLRTDTMQARSDTMKKRKETPTELGEVLARKKVSVVESKAKKKSVDPIPYRANGHESKRPRQEAPCLTNCKRQCEMKSGMVNHNKEAHRKLREVKAKGKKVSAAETKVKKQSVDSIACRANEPASKSPWQVAVASNNCKHRRGKKLDMVTCIVKTLRKLRDVPDKERMGSAVERKLEKQSSNPLSCGANGHASRRTSPGALGSTNCKGKCELNLDMVDPSYQFFLNSLKNDGGHRVLFMPQRGKEVLYEEEEQSSSDSDMIVMDTDPFAGQGDSPFVSSKQYISEDLGGRVVGVSGKFREDLMKNLEKPYDEKEDKDLWHEISNRKNKKRDLNLRSGTKRIKTQAAGKSYLDHHEDLAKMIESAKSNRPKALNLMRGFFYWLQHKPHDAFEPWLDSSCLEVQPRCTQEIVSDLDLRVTEDHDLTQACGRDFS